MTQRTIAKNFNNFRGRDTRSSDLVRDVNFAIEFQNARVVGEDSSVSREGFHVRGDEAQNKGLYTYRYSDTTSGETVEEKISIGGHLYRKKDTTFTISYAGAGTTITFNHALNTTTATYQVDIEVDSVNVFSLDVGTGNEASPVTLADLKTAIELVAGFTCVISGLTTPPAAFMPILLEENFTTGAPDTLAITYYNWERMSTLTNANFSDYAAAYVEDYWELASVVNISNVLLIAHGYGYLYKYDGQNVYRAGMPVADTVATLALGGTGVTDTNIKYIYLYKQIDNQGNEVLGVESDPSAAVSPANQTITVTLPNILAAEEFNTGCAIVNGLQAGVNTITVDAAHTFKIGDTAYFYDGVGASYVERLVTNIAATTITVDGVAVDVADNAVISNNLRIVIYRSTAGGSLYYKVAEIPNDSFNATQAYADALVTASLGTQYIPPVKSRDPLEIFPKYLCVHQGITVAAGDPQEPNTFFVSNGEGPEYFDALSNFEDVRNTSGGGIKGLASDQEYLIIGTQRNLFVFSGDLDSGSGRLEKINEGQMGFACHNSIVDIGQGIMFLGSTGFWLLQNGYNLVEIGNPINSDFTNLDGYADSQLPILKRAIACHFEETEEYICFVPAESGSGSSRYCNSSSVVHVFTVSRNAWSTWTNLNMGGGLTVFDDNLCFQSCRDDPSLTVTGNLWERNRIGALEDYADHEDPIDFRIGTQWLNDNEPSVFKVWLWIKIYNLLRSLLSASFTLTVTVERNYQRNLPWFMFELDFGSDSSSVGYGYFPWGQSIWGTPTIDSNKMKLRSGKAQAIRYVFSNSVLNSKVAISAWETVYTSPYSKEMKD
jgi:hypothetical protein